jgi:hypothetical protein
VVAIHIVFNRIDNSGKTISDKNDRYKSERICKELTDKHNLYFAQGKENVKRHRLKEPDKTKYEIYDALKATVPKCKSWKELHKALEKNGITINFKYKGNTKEVQGIRFEKNGYTFDGSKIDRQFSYSKIDFLLKQNEKAQSFQASREINHSQNQSLASALGGLLDLPTPEVFDYEEGRFNSSMQLPPANLRKRFLLVNKILIFFLVCCLFSAVFLLFSSD